MNNTQAPIYQVLIIGNGPSGIALSNILSGNFPYFSGKVPNQPVRSEEADVFVKCRRNPELSIVEQDLQYLSEGLVGRSSNPVALLFDHLNQPNADTGLYEESTLRWRHCRENEINHLVVGRSPRCGGSWQLMQGAQLTVSLNNWLDLPGWTFQEWLKQHWQQLEKSCTACPLVENDLSGDGYSYDRASTGHVAEYYENYVTTMGLRTNFESNVTVTSVRRVDHCSNLWEVCGVQKTKCQFFRSKKSFKVYAENVVLATGLAKPKKLGIDGEGLRFVHHHLRSAVQFLKHGEGSRRKETISPVVIVGDGLSAADAVLLLFAEDIPVIHILRRDLNDEELILNKLPTQVYHDYAKVKDMMCKPVYSSDGRCLYQAYFKCQLLSISKQKECKMKMVDGKCLTQQVSAVFILIGSKPDLSFLKDTPSLGVDPSVDLDCRHNPIDINPYTYECKNAKNLFAMGPLVGDNFVRFGVGGALGIASHLHKNYRR